MVSFLGVGLRGGGSEGGVETRPQLGYGLRGNGEHRGVIAYEVSRASAPGDLAGDRVGCITYEGDFPEVSVNGDVELFDGGDDCIGVSSGRRRSTV